MAQATQAQLAKKLKARMTDAEHQDTYREFLGLFYGDKGTRKTTTAQGLAQKLRGDGRILFVDSAEGFVSLDRFKALKRNTDRIRIDDPRELMVLSRALRTRAPGYEDYTVIVLDEYSSWWTDTLHSFAREQAGVSEDDELPIIDWTWYGPPQQAMLNVIKNFHKTPGLHVIIVAHEQGRGLKGEKNGPDRFTPLLGTKLSASIGQLAHVVGRFESRKVQQRYTTEVQVQPTRYVEAKSRMDNTDEVKLDSVTLVKTIEDWIYGGGIEAAETQPEQDVIHEEPTEGEDDDEDYEVEEGEA